MRPQTKPQSINLAIDAQGKVHWNGAVVDFPHLHARIAEAARPGSHALLLACR